jgi:Tfp pilus assembly protein PilF
MSLLFDALKKAELAKQAVKERPPATDTPPFTRDQLPDITQPMEIHSEDLSLAESTPAARPVEKPPLELAPEEPPLRPAPTLQPAPAMRAAPVDAGYSPHAETAHTPPGDSAERKQAQQMFEAKELNVNPRKPFYIIVGALVLFALGTVGYFWYQLQPKNSFKLPPPSAQPAPPPIAVAPAAPAAEPGTPAAVTVAPPAGIQPALPAKGGSAPRAAQMSAPAAMPAAPRSPVFARQGAPASDAATAPQPGPARRGRDITITPPRVQSDPVLEGAYQAYNAGDLAKARNDYQQVRRNNPDNRDALLGLAAVETQAGRYDAAEGYYTRLLELDPRDAHAQAALIGLRGQVDPLAAESRLKNMIAAQPGASFLHFTLGNQFATQGRWAEAQQAYFQAYASDPEHADFAYNLAISLDRMHQIKPALEYYRRAMALAESRPALFDKAQVSNRILQLERGP